MSEPYTKRGGHRTADSFRPVSAATTGRPMMTAHSTSYLATPTKQQLREELAEAARNTARAMKHSQANAEGEAA